MGLFPGTFDDLSDDVSSLFGSALSAGGKALSGMATGANSAGQAVSASEARSQREISQLNYGTVPITGRVQTEIPQHTRDASQAAESVNPMELENEWDQRLATYAKVTRETGVGIPGR